MNGLENDSNDEDASGDDEEEAEEEGDDDNLENFDAEEFSEEEEEEKDDGNSMVDDDDVDVDGHKSQLEQLKQKDPEFYKFLQQNDANLLNFGESEDEDDEEDEEVEDDDDQEDEDQEKIKAASDKEQIILSLKLVNSWKSSLNTSKSIRALKKLLVAFRAAVAYSQANDDGDRVDEFAYSIPNSSVHKAVMLATIKYAPIVLSHHLTPTKG